MMKYIISLFLIITSLFATNNHVFLLDEYDKEIDLEAKIISKIAKDTLNTEVKIYIPEISELENKVYSKYFEVVKDCKDANFIYAKKELNKKVCSNKNKIIFTNNYSKLMNQDIYVGAFFWNKSRPNITFIKNRLEKYNISLPKNYDRYIESF